MSSSKVTLSLEGVVVQVDDLLRPSAPQPLAQGGPPTVLFTVDLPTGTRAGGRLSYFAEVANAADAQVARGVADWTCLATSAGVEGDVEAHTPSLKCSDSGTFDVSFDWDFSVAGKASLVAEGDSTLPSPTTFRITYKLENDSQQGVELP